MTSKPKLHAVGDDEVVPEKRKLSIAESADGDDRREFLNAMRARLAKALDDPATPAHALTAMAREVSAIDREIRAMDVDAKEPEHAGGSVADAPFDATVV